MNAIIEVSSVYVYFRFYVSAAIKVSSANVYSRFYVNAIINVLSRLKAKIVTSAGIGCQSNTDSNMALTFFPLSVKKAAPCENL